MQMKIHEVDRGVAIQTPVADGRGRPWKYPFLQMQVGDSFYIPPTEAHPKPWNTLTRIASDGNRKLASEGMRFITRKHREPDGEVGARVFRVE